MAERTSSRWAPFSTSCSAVRAHSPVRPGTKWGMPCSTRSRARFPIRSRRSSPRSSTAVSARIGAARSKRAKTLCLDREWGAGVPGARRWPNVRRMWLPTAGAAIVLALAAAIATRRPGETHAPSFRQLTFLTGAVTSARFAGAGNSVVYTEAWDGSPPRVFTARIGTPDLQRREASNAVLAALSQSGKVALQLAPRLRRGDFIGTLAQSSFAGEAPRELMRDVDYADWCDADDSLAVVRTVGGKS